MSAEYGYAPEHLLAGQPATLAATFADSEGAPVDPGVVTVTITRRDGTALATDAATDGTGAAARTYALTGAQTAALDLLTAVWSGTVGGAPATITTYHETIGAWLFTVAEARQFGRRELTDAARYPAARIAQERARILDDFTRISGVSFVPRSAEALLGGDGNAAVLRLPHLHLRGVTGIATRAGGAAAWEEYDAGALAAVRVGPGGVLERAGVAWRWGIGGVRVRYTHGYDAPPPAIRRAALALLAAQLVPSDVSARATQQTTEYGTYNLAVAGWRDRAYYGIPEVDAVLARYDETVPGIG